MERYSNILEVSIVQRGGLLSASWGVSCCCANHGFARFCVVLWGKFTAFQLLND